MTFFDPEVEIEALRKEKITIDMNTFTILVDSGVMFESIQPFLKTLSMINSTSILFSKYICAQVLLNNIEVWLPKYSTVPGFCFKLQSIVQPGQRIDPLDVKNPASIAWAQAQLQQFSVLDLSQADSIMDSLIKEISLIQG